ncbi:MAG TPA: SusC/RagA family TonB-linked outer membrane protein, partial [Puia sp.]|nr:SusC/RagA family TonB-linked outer membrane protein [Puia sp.]
MNSTTSKRLLWTLFLPLLFFTTARAQQGVITGTVVDESTGQPIAGVTVMVKGRPGDATATDSFGVFRLHPTVNGRIVLRISSVGYESQDYRGGVHAGPIRIALKKSDRSMDEVVVIGYGQTVKKRDLTGAISVVKAADIVRAPTNDPLSAIEGLVPGADITTTNGKENASDSIHIRGVHTFNGLTEPIYVIDGVQGGSLRALNPNDIESIEVLKDASSTAIYGSQGANGVIVVTTKHGTSGKVKVAYNGYMGTNGFVQYPHPRTGQSYIDLRRAAYQASGLWNSPADDSKIFSAGEMAAIQANQWVNWTDLVTNAGLRQSHNVSVSGGTDKSKVYLSAGYYGDDGMIKGNNQKQYNLLLNVDQTIAPWVKTGFQAGLVSSNVNTRSSDPYSLAETAVPLGTPYDSLGRVVVYPIAGAASTMSPLSDNRGPLVATNNSISTATTINAHLDLTPVKGLSIVSRFGANFSSSRSGQYFDSSSLEEINHKYSYASAANNSTRSYEWDNIVTYSKDFGPHSFSVTGLTTYTQNTKEQYSMSGTGLIYSSQLFYSLQGAPDNRYISSNYLQQNNMSYAGRLHYSYKGKYIVDVTDRYDGASILAAGHKNYNFPSAAAAWRISDEDFMQNVNAISNLKLRLSYGVAGNSGIPAYGTQSYLVVQNMGFENTSAPAYIFNSAIGNTNVGWELSKTANLGLDLGLYRDRIDLSVDVYNMNTDNILMLRSLPPSLGVVSTWQNVGSTNNKGIEVSLNTRNIETPNFKWMSTVSFMSNRERVTKLISGTNIIDGQNAEVNSLLLGHPVHSFYNYVKEGIWQTSEASKAASLVFGTTPFAPGSIKMKDLNGNNKISPDSDRTYIGSQEPKFSLGFQNTFVYKNWDLTVYAIMRYGQMIQAQFLGRYYPNGIENGPGYFNYWTPTHASNDFPAPLANESISSIPGYTTLEYVDGSYWKIKTATLGYTLPHRLLKKAFMTNLRAYITVNNIFV